MVLELILGLLLILSLQINAWQWGDNRKLREEQGNLRIANSQLKSKIENLERRM